MILGAQFLPERCDEYLASVRAADEAGYARAWLVDGQMLWQDIYVYMTLGLEQTSHLAFGAAVTNPTTRHFTVTASATATIATPMSVATASSWSPRRGGLTMVTAEDDSGATSALSCPAVFNWRHSCTA